MTGPALPSLAPACTNQCEVLFCRASSVSRTCCTMPQQTVVWHSVKSQVQPAVCCLLLKQTADAGSRKKGWGLLDGVTGRSQGELVIEEAHGEQGHKHCRHANDKHSAALGNLNRQAVSMLQVCCAAQAENATSLKRAYCPAVPKVQEEEDADERTNAGGQQLSYVLGRVQGAACSVSRSATARRA